MKRPRVSTAIGKCITMALLVLLSSLALMQAAVATSSDAQYVLGPNSQPQAGVLEGKASEFLLC